MGKAPKTKSVGSRVAGWTGAAGAIGTPAVMTMAHPMLATVLFAAELALVGMVLLTVMYGSDEHRERCFRLLRLLKGQPEPEPPAADCTRKAYVDNA
jgi:hypothetical protein